MSDATPFAFGKLIPGFDFLQKLATGGGAGNASGLGHWVAPTVNVEELEQRITELKAVQFWLEQNSRALAATIQALEVQRMTLATLQGMNVAMKDLAGGAFKATGAAAPRQTATRPCQHAPSRGLRDLGASHPPPPGDAGRASAGASEPVQEPAGRGAARADRGVSTGGRPHRSP